MMGERVHLQTGMTVSNLLKGGVDLLHEWISKRSYLKINDKACFCDNSVEQPLSYLPQHKSTVPREHLTSSEQVNFDTRSIDTVSQCHSQRSQAFFIMHTKYSSLSMDALMPL